MQIRLCDLILKVLQIAGVLVRIIFHCFQERKTGYIDKTKMIKDLLEHMAYVNLFTRPRRFGKNLNMSMLKYYFEIGCDKMLFHLLSIVPVQKS